MSQNVVEIVKFKLAPGVSEQDFLPLNEAFQAFIAEQPGLLYRSLAKQPDNHGYIDVIYWQSMEDSKRTAEAFNNSAACMDFLALIDKDSVVMTHNMIIAQSACTG
ncbi:antibiotic biosynthesis monooxygenase family protein [Pseudoalteromonas byunsanensis]|uniref:ABM domain-containing protein n=1 Tax=Pseudoalteromonas byunsanensis TaxID=327939 RepID=A0A1S1N4I8_9GAMM|nr:hypothetical protein [Pseudoalteromonas byunsanensis]OHU94569.1 hypothetical protein BIW53_16040 [Pseudoalteromonas byunsanensis]